MPDSTRRPTDTIAHPPDTLKPAVPDTTRPAADSSRRLPDTTRPAADSSKHLPDTSRPVSDSSKHLPDTSRPAAPDTVRPPVDRAKAVTDSIRAIFDSLRRAAENPLSIRPDTLKPVNPALNPVVPASPLSAPASPLSAPVSPSSAPASPSPSPASPSAVPSSRSSAPASISQRPPKGPPGTRPPGRKTEPVLSNLHRRYIPVRKGLIHIDSSSLIPGAFFIKDVPDSAYTLDWVNATLTWRHPPPGDSVLLTYRSFPRKFNAVARRFNYDSISNYFLVQPYVFNNGSHQVDDNFFSFGNITYNGSFGRSITFGNSQDAVVTSNLNLQISGYLADSIEISAAITDNNIPIQPDGTTADLNEFDKIFLQFKKKGWALTMGDIDLRQNQNYFLNFYKRMQGASFETTNPISKGLTNHTMVSAAIAKGKFTRNIFQGLEGNQGPYKLQGANNELYFIVLAGTEKVYIDGQLLQRGEDKDYVINYNTAEITFTANRMVTQDARIQVEFEYADRNYLNVNLYLADEATISNKLKLRMALFSNSDSRNSPINQSLTPDQTKFLNRLGDSVNRAFYPIAGIDTFAAGKILYRKVDTTYQDAAGVTVHDSAYVFSTDPSNTLYSLSFANVGPGYGNYVPNLNGVNGNIFLWVAPVNGQMQGSYEAAQFLVTPKTQRVMTVGADYTINKNTTLSGELATSNYDVNTLSNKDKSNDDGYATKWQFRNVLPLGRSTAPSSGSPLTNDHSPLAGPSIPSSPSNSPFTTHNSQLTGPPTHGLLLTTNLGYEHVQSNFKPLERLRPVEFTRDWGLALNVSPADEKIYNAGLQLTDKKLNTLRYDIARYERGDGFTGMRHIITHRQQVFGWQLNDQLSYTSSDSTNFRGSYLRPSIDISKKFTSLKNYLLGAAWSMERNAERDKTQDTVTATSYAFQTWQAWLKSPEKDPNHWGASFTTRQNAYPYGKSLIIGDRSKTFNLYADFAKNVHRQFHINATYRNLQIITARLTNQTADNSLLGRAEYLANEWKGLLRGNLLYEVGTGQEQKKNFTYLEVPAGTGQYTWIDVNNDGIQQLTEFVLAQFQDQAKYIRVYTPSNEYIKANYNTFNYSFTINPRVLINPTTGSTMGKLLARVILQSSMQLTQKQQARGFVQLNPFKSPLDDTSLITRTIILVNTFSFNRTDPHWGIDISNTRNGTKTLLTYGYEARQLTEWMARGRLNISRIIVFNATLRQGTNQLNNSGSNFDSSNYHLRQFSLEPNLTFTHGANFRIGMGYKISYKTNDPGYGGQKYTSGAYNMDFKYNILQSTSIQSKFTYSDIVYKMKDGAASTTSSVSYVMLEGLLPGKNYLWNIDLTKKLGSNLEFSLQYEGRKAGQTNIVHTGRAALRAIL